jgi:hypothetical protein
MHEKLYRLFVIQRADSFRVLRRSMDLETAADFNDPNLLETVLEVKLDESEKDILDIMVDVLPWRTIEVYVVYPNFMMKRWTAMIPYK